MAWSILGLIHFPNLTWNAIPPPLSGLDKKKSATISRESLRANCRFNISYIGYLHTCTIIHIIPTYVPWIILVILVSRTVSVKQLWVFFVLNLVCNLKQGRGSHCSRINLLCFQLRHPAGYSVKKVSFNNECARRARHSLKQLLETTFQVIAISYHVPSISVTLISKLVLAEAINNNIVYPSRTWALPVHVHCEVAIKLVQALLVFSIKTLLLGKSSAGFKHAY